MTLWNPKTDIDLWCDKHIDPWISRLLYLGLIGFLYVIIWHYLTAGEWSL